MQLSKTPSFVLPLSVVPVVLFRKVTNPVEARRVIEMTLLPVTCFLVSFVIPLKLLPLLVMFEELFPPIAISFLGIHIDLSR